MKVKKSRDWYIFQAISITVLTLGALIAVFPFVVIISGSLSDNELIARTGYSILPKGLTTAAYRTILRIPQSLLTAYRVTIVNTVCGSLIGLLCMSMAGYALSRKDFRHRNVISFLIYFTTIFGGGLVPWYIMIANTLSLKDNLLALCLPLLMNPFMIFLMRTFIANNVPDSIIDSCRVDGAGEFTIFFRIVLPLIPSALATIGLFLGLMYWNDWYMSSMFISSPAKFELQFYLYNMLSGFEAFKQMNSAAIAESVAVPSETVKLAMAVFVTGPIILLYPFVQKYFIAGITIGAVKG
ncbi:MAG: carbohydrate ABC transporter permease [Lachnospiraceae bacterium]|jgi:putative aldouronate transport system permease protein|nr:carbohydrate ABC transporter permease [Lachnospiraceae bacterium]